MTSITDTTLLEQMHITDRGIAFRKRLFGFTGKDVSNLVGCREWITEHIDEIIEEVFRQRLAEPEMQLVIGDHETLERLKESTRHYILELFQGYYDEEYVNKRLRVGKVQSCSEKRFDMYEMVKLADAKMYQAKELSQANPGHHIKY